MSSIITNKKLPENSLAAFCFSTINYSDAFSCIVKSQEKITPEIILKAFFTSAPIWITKLLLLRNRIVKLFGIKVPKEKNRAEKLKNFTGNVGDKLGLFEVFDKKENEILVGEDNIHLNFRVSFFLNEIEMNHYEITISTIVKYNNLLGKIYFIPVKPFHKIIVPAMMRNMIVRLNTKQEA